MAIAQWILFAGSMYLTIGIAFAAVFAATGVKRIDRTAHGSTLGFRIVIVPGAMALWPLLLLRWMGGENDAPLEENAHRRSAKGGDLR